MPQPWCGGAVLGEVHSGGVGVVANLEDFALFWEDFRIDPSQLGVAWSGRH